MSSTPPPVIDPRLDRLPSFDPRSRLFTVRNYLDALPPAKRMRGRAWMPGPILDQGQEGACVGFCVTHVKNARPAAFNNGNVVAQQLYKRAQDLDEWPGNSYSGTSVLAGCKAAVEMGWFDSFYWIGAGSGTPVEDTIDAIDHVGPVAFGLPWLDTMFEPRPSGLLDCTGKEIGGHGIAGIATRFRARLKGEGTKPLELIVLAQSWGLDHGVGGYGQPGGFVYMKLDDFDMLVNRGGEGAVLIDSRK